jgi:riboflavin synthase
MFTGLVREIGRVKSLERPRLIVEAPGIAAKAAVGDSISVAGVCLTVASIRPHLNTFGFDVHSETLSRSRLGDLAEGESLNLEPAIRAGDEMGGHIVQGHVDAIGRTRSVDYDEPGLRTWFDAPPEVLRYCVEKGSIAVDGVSLTIAALDEAGFSVALITHTLIATTLGTLEPGDPVNLEADVIAKYVERLTMNR